MCSDGPWVPRVQGGSLSLSENKTEPRRFTDFVRLLTEITGKEVRGEMFGSAKSMFRAGKGRDVICHRIRISKGVVSRRMRESIGGV